MDNFTTRPEIRGTFGVVSSTHWLASQVGMGVLERGGNAFDAAVATAFTLQVVEPHLNGPGGDVPILLQVHNEARPQVLCGQGPAPMAATIDHFRTLGLDLVPGTGHLAAVVPGAFGAWLTLLRDHGTLRLADVLAPAIAYARDGYPLIPRIAQAIANVRDVFEQHWPSSAAIYLPGGQIPEPFRLFRNPTLAATYQRIVDDSWGGPRTAEIDRAMEIFYEGFVAAAMIDFHHLPAVDVTGRANVGLLERDDLAAWRPTYEVPAAFAYDEVEVFKCGPWSQGPAFLQQLALLSGFDVAGLDPNGPELVHLVTECAKLALADRDAHYGDPDFVEVPLTTLLSPAYNAERRQLIGAHASHALQPGQVGDRVPQIPNIPPPVSGGGGAGEPTMARYPERAAVAASGDTCHLDVIDRDGNMVAATPSGGWLQSSPAVPQLGFGLPTRAQMFWLQEGLPSSLGPGRRPRTTLSPSLAHRNGKPYMVFGTPGGDQQDQWSLTFLLRHLHHDMNLQEAIDAPSFHNDNHPSSFYPRQRQPGRLTIEARFPEATRAELARRGHDLDVSGDWTVGRLAAAARDPDGILKAASTPRGMQGYAVGR